MNNTITTSNTQTNKALITIFVLANLLTQFLFFIDEGYYSCKWMLQLGNWIPYILYVLFLFGFQTILFFILKKIIPLKNNIAITSVFMLLVCILFIIVIAFR